MSLRRSTGTERTGPPTDKPARLHVDPRFASYGFAHKLGRALEHINTLEDELWVWMNEHPYAIVKELEPYGGDATLTRHVVRLRQFKPIPAHWSLIAGDAAHNLRCCLDHIALALNAKEYADANGGAELPPNVIEKSEFPIFQDVDAEGNAGTGASMFARAVRRRLPHAPSSAIEIIERIQPYALGPEARAHPLWLIHDLDRADKHRDLLLTTSIAETRRMDISLPSVVDSLIGISGPVEDGSELSWWVPSPGSAEPRTNLSFEFNVAFGDGTDAEGFVIGILRETIPAINGVAEQLLPCL